MMPNTTNPDDLEKGPNFTKTDVNAIRLTPDWNEIGRMSSSGFSEIRQQKA
jgi:hypothetical protein